MTAYLSHLMYLRKSRQDDPNETVEEVLAKHETILQEFAERELGGRIPRQNIFREIVSGESIEDREEIKKVLSMLESPAITGVLCMEPSRLSRGDLSDCSKIIDAFRFTHTVVTTPYMTYDLEKKMERKFFQDELLRGNDYLEYTKEILWRGRVASIKRGCFIGARPPYGFDRVLMGKDHSLKANENAGTVRMIFDWYVKEGMTTGEIARKLNSLGYKPTISEKWDKTTVKGMLENVHYIGKVRFNDTKITWVMENGERVKKWVKQPEEEVIIAEGKHSGIVDPEIFEAAQTKLKSAPRVKKDRELVNPLAGILRCGKCGRAMPFYAKDHSRDRYSCPSKPRCYKSTYTDAVISALIDILEKSKLPEFEAKLENGENEAALEQKKRLNMLLKQMEEYREQEETQYELLEQKKYTQEIFDKRNAKLREKMEECEKNIFITRTSIPKNINYADKIAKLKDAIAGLKDNSISPKNQNRMLRSIIDHIDYTAVDHGFNKTEFDLDITFRY